MNRLYRPVDCAFLDQCSPLAFWISQESAKRDFPDNEVQVYTEDEVIAYCRSKNLNPEDVQHYG